MPAKAHARLQIISVVRQSLPVIPQTQIECEIRRHPETILQESRQQPLVQIVSRNAKVDRLRVVLNIVQGQLIQWRRRRVLEGESAQRCLSRLTAEPA